MEGTLITLQELGVSAEFPLPKRSDWGIGMVGFGGIARTSHAPAYKNAGWKIVAVADPDEKARTLAKDEFGVEHVYADYHELIEDPAVEVIDLLTQPSVREEVLLAAARVGKPIITEKPLTQNPDEGVRMVAVAEKAGITFGVHQNYRWMTMNYLARQIVERGIIGDPFFVSIEIFGTQDRDLAGHHFYSVCDNFLTIQWNNHLADLVRYWTGRDAKRVFARTGRSNGQNFVSDNLLSVIHDLGDGLTGHILHSELVRSGLTGVECRIDGAKGTLLFDFHSTMRISSDFTGKGVHTLDVKEHEFRESFIGSMADFLCAIEDGREPVVSARRNLATVRTFLAEHESARRGGAWVEV
ncbi:MAG TPA: Gfo/Idh/MocA family oxidoreductase [Candidatus Latescibacteria bacterium]|nr:Gfo/Idh/MocA family oxidoreductase [Candidatus Latescibacterota bacterium]